MSKFDHQELSKKTARLQRELSSSETMWSEEREREQKNINNIKQTWQKKQNQKYSRLRHRLNEHRDIKMVISSLTMIAVVVFIIPYFPKWWQLSKELLADSSIKKQTVIQKNSDSKSTGIWQKLIELSNQKAEMDNVNDNTDLSSQTCDSLAEIGCSSEESSSQPEQIIDNTIESTEKLQKNRQEYYQDLQKAIDMSDGK